MKRTAQAEALVAGVGVYTAGPSWVHASVEDGLFALLLFGRPTEADMRGLVESLRVELDDDVPAHRSLVDAGRIESVDLGAFEVLNDYVVEHRERLSRQVTALSLVRPSGMEGAVVAGFFEVLEAPYPVRVFDNAEMGLAWLEVSDSARVQRDLTAVVATERGAPPILTALRAYLAAALSKPAMAAAGQHLEISPRTLQRRLAEIDTSFQQEVLRARLAEAERRMLSSDASLTAIAIDAGFGTLQQFSSAFKRVYGEKPSDWRAARRRR